MIRTSAPEPQRIVVTGATGVIGRRLVPALVADGHTVFGLARSSAAATTLAALGAHPVDGDLMDADAVDRALREARPTVVMHQATAAGAAGTANVVAAAERHGAQRLVAQSTAFAYAHRGRPDLDESAPLDDPTVAELEDRVMGAGQMQGVVLRYGRLYGPGTAISATGSLGGLARRRRLPVVGAGGGRTSLIHIDDAIGATLDAIDRGWGVYNVCDDVPAPARDWIPAFAAAIGAPPPRRVPALAARLTRGRRSVREMTTQRGALNAKARADLGWQLEFSDWRDGFRTLAGGPRTPEPAPSGA